MAELAVREIISNLGLVVVGWYHSHPLFQPDPSVTDINNQQQYQTLMRDEKSGFEPFIGLIVSTYDVKLPSVESHHQWFHTRPYSDGTRGKKPVPIPMLLETNIGIYADMNQNIDLFLDSDQTDDLLSKLMNLSPASNTVNSTNALECEEKGIGIKKRTEKFISYFSYSFYVKFKIFPGICIANKIPSCSICTKLANRREWIYHIAFSFGHFLTIFIQNKSIGNNRFKRDTVKNNGSYCVERIKPSPGLIHTFCNKICREYTI